MVLLKVVKLPLQSQNIKEHGAIENDIVSVRIRIADREVKREGCSFKKVHFESR